MMRAPKRSSITPMGNCENAYANENAESSRPICEAERPSSCVTE